MVETHAQQTLEAEIKRIVEKSDTLLNDGNLARNPGDNLIQAIQQQVKGKKQMDKLLEIASESEQNSTQFISLRNEGGHTAVHTMLNNLPDYVNSKVWQDWIKRKASMSNEFGTPTKKADQQQTSPRGPGFSYRKPLNVSNLTGKKPSQAHSLTTRNQQQLSTQYATTQNASGFFPQVKNLSHRRTQSIDQGVNTMTAGFIGGNHRRLSNGKFTMNSGK